MDISHARNLRGIGVRQDNLRTKKNRTAECAYDTLEPEQETCSEPALPHHMSLNAKVIRNAVSRSDVRRMLQHKEQHKLPDPHWNVRHKSAPNFSHTTGKVRSVQKVGTFLFACVLFSLATDSTQHGVI